MILAKIFTFIVKRNWKTCILTHKWLDHLLMTWYLVTIEIYHHWTRLKIRQGARDKRTASENALSSTKKTQKNLRGVTIAPPPLPSVRSRVNFQTITKTLTNWKSIWNKDRKNWGFFFIKLKEKEKNTRVK